MIGEADNLTAEELFLQFVQKFINKPGDLSVLKSNKLAFPSTQLLSLVDYSTLSYEDSSAANKKLGSTIKIESSLDGKLLWEANRRLSMIGINFKHSSRFEDYNGYHTHHASETSS